MDLYDFEDYRRYLNAWLGTGQPARTLRALAKRLDMSHSLVSMVRNGRRDLRLSDARHWAWALRLDPRETEYWEALVTQEHGPSRKIREDARREAAAVRSWQAALRDEALLRLYSDWYIPAIAELARVPGFQLDPEWIAARLMPPVRVDQAQEALELLFQAGVLTHDGGAVQVQRLSVSTGRRFRGSDLNRAATAMHREFLSHAADAVMTVPSDERFCATLVLSLSDAQLSRASDTLERILIEAGEVDETRPSRVYQVGVYLVPRSTTGDSS